MAWFAPKIDLSTIKNQLATSIKEVLDDDGDESPGKEGEELGLLKAEIKELESLNESLRKDKDLQCRQLKDLLIEKETEIEHLKGWGDVEFRGGGGGKENSLESGDTEKQALVEELQRIQSEYQDLGLKTLELENALDKKEGALQDLLSQGIQNEEKSPLITSLEEGLKKKEAQELELHSLINQLRKESSIGEERIQSLQETLIQRETTIKEIQSMPSKITVDYEEISNLKEELRLEKNKVNSKENELKEKREEIDSLESRIQDRESAESTLKKTVEKLEKEIKTSSSDVDVQLREEEIDTLKTQLKSLKDEFDNSDRDYRTRLEMTLESEKSLKVLLLEKEETINSLNADADRKEGEILKNVEDLKHRLNALTDENANVKKQLEEKSTELDSLHIQFDEKDSDESEIHILLEKYKLENEDLQYNLREKEKLFDEMENTKIDLEQQNLHKIESLNKAIKEKEVDVLAMENTLIKKDKSFKEEIEEADIKIKSLEKSLYEIQDSEKSVTEPLNKYETEIEQLRNELKLALSQKEFKISEPNEEEYSNSRSDDAMKYVQEIDVLNQWKLAILRKLGIESENDVEKKLDAFFCAEFELKRCQDELKLLNEESSESSLEESLGPLIREVKEYREKSSHETEELHRLTVEKDKLMVEHESNIKKLDSELKESKEAEKEVEEQFRLSREELNKYKSSLEVALRDLNVQESRIVTITTEKEKMGLDMNKLMEQVENSASQSQLSEETFRSENSHLNETIVSLQAQNDELKCQIDNLNELRKELDKKAEEIAVLNLKHQSEVDSIFSGKNGIIQDKENEIKGLVEKLSESKNTIHNISNIVKEKEVETESLKLKNDSLALSLQKQNNSGNVVSKEGADIKNKHNALLKERQEMINTLNIKHQESLRYHEEIQRLNKVLESKNLEISKLKIEMDKGATFKDQNENQNVDLPLSGQRRKRFLSESLIDNDKNDFVEFSVGKFTEFESKMEKLQNCLKNKEKDLNVAIDEISKNKELFSDFEKEKSEWKRQMEMKAHIIREQEHKISLLTSDLQTEIDKINDLKERDANFHELESKLKLSIKEKEHDLLMSQKNLKHITALLNEKDQSSQSQKAEMLQSLTVIEELQLNLRQLTKVKNEADESVSTKANELLELRKEVNNLIDKKRRLEQELERLKSHLVTVEENYTVEALESENRERELKKKLLSTEEALRDSSAKHSTAIQEATQLGGSLESQVITLTSERDVLIDKFKKMNADYKDQSKALENLQMALDGFRSEQENQTLINRQQFQERLKIENEKRADLESQLSLVQKELYSAQEHLLDRDSLSDQIERKSKIISALKQEINVREDLLKKTRSELEKMSETQSGKVDQTLVKNLVVGYVSADDKKKIEILRIISTVLNFSLDEKQKIGLEGGKWGSWFGGSEKSDIKLDQSLVSEFVKFLETESAPKSRILPMPKDGELSTSSNSELPGHKRTNSTGSNSSNRSSPNLLLGNNANVMPTFSVNRSSSSILKHVLQEEKE